MPQSRANTLLDDVHAHYPDACDQLVIDAVRAWFRPNCDAVRNQQTWRDVLSESGSTPDGLHCFDVLMTELARTVARPLDIRCRCCHGYAGDEACLLQTIACFQSNDQTAANALLADWIAAPAVERLANIAHWFALALLDTGVTVRKRMRRVNYLH